MARADPVARYRRVSTKCLVTAGGVPMLVRVRPGPDHKPATSAESWCHSTIRRCSTGCPSELRGLGRLVQVLASSASLSASVAAAFAAGGPPLLVTTADHALLEPGHGRRSSWKGPSAPARTWRSALAGGGHDPRQPSRTRGAPICASATTVIPAPTCSCCAHRRRASGIAFWRRIERDRKAPWRLARALGPLLLLVATCCGLRDAGPGDARWSRAGSASRAAAVVMPMAEAAIDVDKPADLDLVERILAARRRRAPA